MSPIRPGTVIRPRTVLPILLLLGTAGLLPVVNAQHGAGQDDGGQQKPEQTHASPIEEPFLQRETPAFLYGKKGRKWTEEMKEWRVVDLEKRKEDELARIDKAIEEEREKPEDQRTAGRLDQLQRHRGERYNFYKGTSMLLEKADDTSEFIRITAEEFGNGTKLMTVVPKETVTKWSGYKSLYEADVSPKALARKGGGRYTMEFTATPAQEGRYYYVDTYLVPARDGSRMFRFLYIHQMPASRANEDTRKEVHQLASLLQIAG